MDLSNYLDGALATMMSGPKKLVQIMTALMVIDEKQGITDSDLRDFLISEEANSPVIIRFHIQMSTWDQTGESEAWCKGTPPKSEARRNLILESLGFSEELWTDVSARFPLDILNGPVIISNPEDWDPWYTSEVQGARSFYWEHYQSLLTTRGWEAGSLATLDLVTREIVGRLADPTRDAPYQSKGLVVGHVQSGKTANFTGVVAKAIDAGYRLVIVLTGTIELLRKQTQRRLDMELVGRENILGGADENDPQAVQRIDYVSTADNDWVAGKFVSHGDLVNQLEEIPGIRRLTGLKHDYMRLAHGLAALDFRAGNELKNRNKPVFDPSNLFATDVRLAVVKKNAGRLQQLVQDLKNLHTDLSEIPVLIIDDEADLASVNTRKPPTISQTPAQKRADEQAVVQRTKIK